MIGVVGGMGVYAGTDLVDKISDATIADCDQDFLPVALLSMPQSIPDRSEYLLGSQTGPNPGTVVSEQISKLATLGCTVCGIACNTFHAPAIFGSIANRPEVRVVNILSETCDRLQESSLEVGKVAILGTRGTVQLGLYKTLLEKAGLVVQDLPALAQELVTEAIRDVPNGLKRRAVNPSDLAVDNIVAAVDLALAEGVNSVVLGCTEIPFVVRRESAREAFRNRNVSIVDPARLLARALVREYAPDKLAEGSWMVDL